MALLQNVNGRGTLASRPAAGSPGVTYFAIDSAGGTLFRDNGTSWDSIECGGQFAGEVSGTDLKATGLTGAATAARFVGANTSGPPTTGTFVAGDCAVDLTGQLYICITGGTPGTWIGAGSNKIDEQILASAAASVTFSSIPADYRHLRLVAVARGDTAANIVNVLLTLNADSGTNYDYQSETVATTADTVSNAFSQTSLLAGIIAAASAPTNAPGSLDLSVLDYARTSFLKMVTSETFADGDTTSTANFAIVRTSGVWKSTAAVTSLTVAVSAGNFAAGSIFELFGVR